MTIRQLAKKLKIKTDELEEKAGGLLVRNALRDVEAELYALMGKHGVRTVDELDEKVREGKVKEEELGEDFFRMDYLLEKKEKLKALTREFPKHESFSPWIAIADLPASLRLNFPR